MKTYLVLALTLLLGGAELRAQIVPAPTTPAPSRPPRYGITNGATGTRPRYPARPTIPGATTPGATTPQGTAPGAATRPGGAGTPGAPGAPGSPGTVPGEAAPMSLGSSAFANSQEEMIAPGLIDFEGVEINQVLEIYAKLVHRTLLRAQLPQAQVVLHTETPLTKSEAIQALQAVLALNGVSLVNIGDKFVKVVPSDQAGTAGQEIDRSGSTNIPTLGSYITHVVQLKYVKPTEMVQVIQPFSKLPNSILAIDGNGILVLRDYAENVKRMLEMIEQVDVSVPAEYISEVIPIRYAKVDDIASALNALGGGGGATVSIGSAPTTGTISGLAPNRIGSGFAGSSGMSGMGGMSGVGGMGGMGGMGGGGFGGGAYGGSAFGGGSTLGRTTGGTTASGTPSTGTTFQQRLQSILGATGGSGARGGTGPGGQDQIQLFGQTKIIPNESSSSLLIYATRADMEVIKGIIAKLDVPLAQVLVEAVIMDVNLGNTFNFGVSAAQNPAQNGKFIGGGGMVNSSSPFISFMQNITTNYSVSNIISGFSSSVTSSAGTNGSFGNALPGGFSYFGNIGPNWDVAVTAAESDTHANIIQRPRIQTSQAKAAQFFVGNTVPYVTGTYNGYNGYGGNSYAQLSVGVELDVTPFINPEGLVVMDIMQEIDDLNGFTTIQNVGDVPNTIKRTLNTEIAIRDRDTVMLGGFIKSDKSHTQSGVPFLSDIPILGNLFKSRADKKDREELIVLMRPTVLKTPELAAKNTIVEERRLPGVSEAASEDASYERSLIEAQRKREMKKFKDSGRYEGFFGPDETNSVPATPEAATEKPPQPEAAAEVINPLPEPVHPQAQAPGQSGQTAPATGTANPPADGGAQPKPPEPQK